MTVGFQARLPPVRSMSRFLDDSSTLGQDRSRWVSHAPIGWRLARLDVPSRMQLRRYDILHDWTGVKCGGMTKLIFTVRKLGAF